MKPTDYQQLREIFLGARERQGDEREAWLLEACSEDEELLAEVRRLLASEEAATSFLELGDVEDKSSLSPGDRIGPYILREPIGEGGFAEVFLAEQQEPVRRRVALLRRHQRVLVSVIVWSRSSLKTWGGSGTSLRNRPFFSRLR